MREITEEEANRLAGDADCTVLAKEESDPMEAAVCLKQFPGGYLLGASDRTDRLRLWFSEDETAARGLYAALCARMRTLGTPL